METDATDAIVLDRAVTVGHLLQLDEDEGDLAALVFEGDIQFLVLKLAGNRLLNLVVSLDEPLDLDLLLVQVHHVCQLGFHPLVSRLDFTLLMG